MIERRFGANQRQHAAQANTRRYPSHSPRTNPH
jgi:hypothetical protein